MKILFLDLSNGVSGDMFAGALFSLLKEDERESFLSVVNNCGLPGVVIKPEKTSASGILSYKMHVMIDGKEELPDGEREHDHEHEHKHAHDHDHTHSETHHHGERSIGEINGLIDSLKLQDEDRTRMKEIYGLLSEAEAKAHDKPVSMVHFHELGTYDAIADIMNAVVLMRMIGPGRVVANSVNLGNGKVRCAHGILPVPAPAVANLLTNLPISQKNGGKELGELTTPTGAVLVKYFVNSFGEIPEMALESSGYGQGDKDIGSPNVLHALCGYTVSGEDASPTIHEFIFTIDDMRGEDLSFAADCLRDSGAVDVYFTPVFMKKGRPAYVVTVLCPEGAREEILHLIFQHTSTIGLREYVSKRVVLSRHLEKRKTRYGDISVKVSEGYGVRKVKPEYEELVRFAAENDIGIRELREQISKEI